MIRQLFFIIDFRSTAASHWALFGSPRSNVRIFRFLL